MYLVQKMFTDLQDDGHRYEIGDEYPREGYEPTPERIAELASGDNKRGVELIREVKEAETPKKKSGGRKKASK